jgi:threonine/homoserine/homoserine lactone efflux protein
MKLSTKASILILIGSALMLTGVFAKPLGIPTSLEGVPILAALVLIYLGYRVSKKAVQSGQVTPLSEVQRRKRFFLMAVVCAVACVAMPFVMPLTGVSLPFGQMAVVSVISYGLCLGAMWMGLRMKK